MTRRKWLVRVMFVLLLYAAVEFVSQAGLWVLYKSRGIAYFPVATDLDPSARRGLDSLLKPGSWETGTFDAELGWRSRRNLTSQNVRDDRLYTSEPPPGILRIATFGDSFTYGSDVKLGENWSKRISAMDSTIEILNHASGAYGLDQAYLRYLREGMLLHPHIVVIGYMSENLARTVNVFRAFYGNGYRSFFFSKPRFKVSGDTLALLPNPLNTMEDYVRLRDSTRQVLRELGRNDYYYAWHYGSGPLDFSPTVRLTKLVVATVRKALQTPVFAPDGMYDTESEAFGLTLRIFDSFYRKVLEDGALPLIVVFPDVTDQERSRAGLPRRYAPLLSYFDSKGYRYIDVLGAFEPVEDKYTMAELSQLWGHYTVFGNDLVARYILAELARRKLHDVRVVDSLAMAERARLR
jgi:hypothetical protein